MILSPTVLSRESGVLSLEARESGVLSLESRESWVGLGLGLDLGLGLGLSRESGVLSLEARESGVLSLEARESWVLFFKQIDKNEHLENVHPSRAPGPCCPKGFPRLCSHTVVICLSFSIQNRKQTRKSPRYGSTYWEHLLGNTGLPLQRGGVCLMFFASFVRSRPSEEP